MPIQNYSQDVFFYPWVGKNYGDGINFAPDGRLIFFNKEDEKWYYYDESNTLQEAQNIPANYRPLRLEVLGKEHYCSPDDHAKHIRNRNNDQATYINLLSRLSNQPGYVQKQINSLLSQAQQHQTCSLHLTAGAGCAYLTVCHHKTNEVIEDFLINPRKKYYKSFYNFSNALTLSDKNFLQIWNHLLFCEFYQKGMPKETGNSHSEIDKDLALKAFAEVIKQHQPDIIITWGKPGQQKHNKIPLLELQDPAITLRQMPWVENRNYVIPRLHIFYLRQEEKGSKYTIPFTVLDYNGKPCLVLMPTHPGTSYDFTKINTVIRCAFKYYEKLIRWNPTANEKNLSHPITCEFTSCRKCEFYLKCTDKIDIRWTNESDFNKCI